MNKFIKEKIAEHCESVKPEEACGLVCVDMTKAQAHVVPCTNQAQDKKNQFIISSVDFCEAESKYGKVVTVYHSHVNSDIGKAVKFSSEDIEICDEVQIPFLLYTIPNNEWKYYEPKNFVREKLLNRPYIRGLWDCYLDARDWYELHGIYLNYYFPPYDNRFTNYNYFEENLEKEGFYKVPFKDMKYGDALLFNYGKTNKYINHCGIYVGGNQIFHHPTKGISSVNDIDGRLMDHFVSLVRHKEFNHDQGEVIWKTR